MPLYYDGNMVKHIIYILLILKAGFFYSCRRLTKAEATCFSCGRQVRILSIYL